MKAILASAILVLVGLAFTAPAADKQVGVLWFEKSGMADKVLRGFAQRLSAAPGLVLEVKMALKTEEEAGKVYAEFLQTKDAVVFLRSHGAKYMLAHPPTKPAFIGAANNPVELGVIKDPAKPEGNITGVTYYLPVAQQFTLYRQLWPKLAKVGLVLMKGHASTPIESAETAAAAKALGIAVAEVQPADKAELAAQVKKLVEEDKVELLVLGNQNLVFDNGPLIAQVAGKTPIMSLSEKPITAKAAIGGLVANDEKLGALLAESVIAVLVQNKPITEVPVKTDPSPRLILN